MGKNRVYLEMMRRRKGNSSTKRVNTLSGMKRGFHGFFYGKPFNVFNTKNDPTKQFQTFGEDVVQVTPRGQVRINPGVPIVDSDFWGTSMFPYNYRPPIMSPQYLRHKLYQTAWKLGQVKNLTPSITKNFKTDMQFIINSLKKQYPFDYSNTWSKIGSSLNRAFSRAKSGVDLQSKLYDVIRELDFSTSRINFMATSPFR